MGLELIILITGAFFAAFAVGAVGFADALIAGAFWLHILDPVDAVPLILATGFVMHAIGIWLVRDGVRPVRLKPLILGGAVGVPLGAWMLTIADPLVFKICIGAIMVIYAVIFLSIGVSKRLLPETKTFASALGLTGGVMGGLSGLAGVPVNIWSRHLGIDKIQQRGIYQPYNLAMHGMTLGWLASWGVLNARLVDDFLICIGPVLIGSWLGLKVFGRLDEVLFRRVVLSLFLVSGISLVTAGVI
jgi:uncharacterized membrane protein YfcA